MKIATVVANGYRTSLITPNELRKIGAVWGNLESVNAWRADNVVCYNNESARVAINLGVHNNNYFFTHQSNFDAVGKLKNVFYFGGEFPSEFSRPDEIVAMNLAGAYFDLVILLGFNLAHADEGDQANFIQSAKSAITQNPDTQWVAVLDRSSFSVELNSLDNFTTDSIESIVSLASE